MSGWVGTSGSVTAARVDGVATVTLDRPAKLNALTEAMLADLADAVRWHDGDGETCALVLTGAGTAFTAGQDLEQAAGHGLADLDRVLGRFNDVTRAILSSRLPVLAALNGIAVGGGAEISFCCDARIAGERGEIFQPENARGLMISNGSSYLLPRLIGAQALPLVLGARRLGAREALELGLVDRVVPDAQLLAAATDQARAWGGPGTSAAQHLRALRPPLAAVEAAMAREVELARDVLLSGATTAGVAAFLGRGRAASGG